MEKSGQATFTVIKPQESNGSQMLANHEIRHISEVHDLTREQIYDIKSRFNSMCHLSSRQNVEEPGIPHEYYIANIDFMAYCLKHIGERILKAAGIDISNPKVQICWQQFLELHCTFKQGRISDEYQIRLWCKFFDPKMTGLVSESKYMVLDNAAPLGSGAFRSISGPFCASG